jgi:hypothetical protein
MMFYIHDRVDVIGGEYIGSTGVIIGEEMFLGSWFYNVELWNLCISDWICEGYLRIEKEHVSIMEITL